MAHRTLALAIPTYNRAAVVEENLLAMRATLERLSIAVHLLDDSSDDATAAVVERLRATTGLTLHYRRNVPALRHDANVIATLLAPDTDHVWVLGDALYVEGPALEALASRLHGQDFVFMHSHGGRATLPVDRLEGPQIPPFLAARTWDITNTGATVYGRRVIDWWRQHADRPVYRNFPQLSVVLGFAAAHGDVTASWVGAQTVHSHPNRPPSYWLASALQVWGADWHAVITANAAAFGAGDLAQVLKSHARHTGLLGAKHLLVLRAAGLLTQEVWQQQRAHLLACSAMPAPWLHTMMALPASAAAKIVARRPTWQRRYLPPPPATP